MKGIRRNVPKSNESNKIKVLSYDIRTDTEARYRFSSTMFIGVA